MDLVKKLKLEIRRLKHKLHAVSLALDSKKKDALALGREAMENRIDYQEMRADAATYKHALGDLLVFSEKFRAAHVASNGAKVMSLLSPSGVAFEEAIKRAMEKMNEGSGQSRESSTSPKTG